LYHQSTWNSDGTINQIYNTGTAEKAPIMGTAYFAARELWWMGPSENGPGNIQDDLSIISSTSLLSNKFGYRPDDHGSTLASADVLPPGLTFSVTGVIEQTTDTDFFSFTTPGGTASFHLNVADFGAMLDGSLQLLDSTGNILATAATPSLSESLAMNLGAGSYALKVLSAGNYGDIGQYTLSGSLVPEPGVMAFLAPSLLLLRRRVR
jgi:hypothetical protein